MNTVRTHSVALPRFSFVLLIGLLSSGCISSRRIQDYTVARSSSCEVHGSVMNNKLVPQTFGMKRSGWILKLRNARECVFPHADEIYDTSFCMPSNEQYARIWVCRECTAARTKWLLENPPFLEEDSSYVRFCDLMWKEFRESFVGRK